MTERGVASPLAIDRKLNRRNPLQPWLKKIVNFNWASIYLACALDEYLFRHGTYHPRDDIFEPIMSFLDRWQEKDRDWRSNRTLSVDFPNLTQYKLDDDIELAYKFELSNKWTHTYTFERVWTKREKPIWWNNPLLIKLDDAAKMI